MTLNRLITTLVQLAIGIPTIYMLRYFLIPSIVELFKGDDNA